MKYFKKISPTKNTKTYDYHIIDVISFVNAKKTKVNHLKIIKYGFFVNEKKQNNFAEIIRFKILQARLFVCNFGNEKKKVRF
jgi:hypothetical protein